LKIAIGRDLIKFEEVKPGIQKVSLNIQELYANRKDQEEFEERLCQFLKSDPYNSHIIRLEDKQLIYRTECILPEKKDSRLPLLLLLGNPASHSVYSEMFFSFESARGREHRFWGALKKAGILSFRSSSNLERKKELYDLSYNSPFRIGLATFYSMPSGASGMWLGVDGLRKLFRKKALRRIADCEKARVDGLIRKFLSPEGGAVFAFQKDAYLGIKSRESHDYNLDETKKGELVGVCQCDSNVRLYCLPPTRLIEGKKTLDLLHNFRERVLGDSNLRAPEEK
jgi:hypothetical protein